MKYRALFYAAGFYLLGLITGFLIGSGALRPARQARQSSTAPMPAQETSAPARSPKPTGSSSVPETHAGATTKPQDETAVLRFSIPSTGTDYDTIETAWIRPLSAPDQRRDAAATLMPGGPSFQSGSGLPPLQDAGATTKLPPPSGPLLVRTVLGSQPAPSLTLPTGVYRITLKSLSDQERIRPCVLVPALELRAEIPCPPVPVPPSLSGDYVGFGGIVPALEPHGTPIGFFCGITLDIQANSGRLLVAFQTLSGTTVRFPKLKPRPDTSWPISNVYLEDSARVAFDCAMNHADFRVTIDASDGRTTMVPRFMAPESGEARVELLTRMRALMKEQLRASQAAPEDFDSAFRGIKAEELPTYKKLETLEQFEKHLARMELGATATIEIGSELSMKRTADGHWKATVKARP